MPHEGLVDVAGVENPAAIRGQSAQRMRFGELQRIRMLVIFGGNASPEFDFPIPSRRVCVGYNSDGARCFPLPRNFFVRGDENDRQLS